MDNYWAAVVWSIAPTIVVSVVFFYVLRSILRADRTERRVYAEVEAGVRAKRAEARQADTDAAPLANQG